MANATVTRIGSHNQVTTDLEAERKLFLKVFSGEVLTAFAQTTTVMDKHWVKTIQSGKSASFPLMGRMPEAEYHVPGTEMLGQQANHGERTIKIDRLLTSHVFLDDLDEAMIHYDVRSRYANEMGNRLAVTYDQNVYRNILKAARGEVEGDDISGDGQGQGLVITNASLAYTDLSTDTKRKTAFTAWRNAIEQLAANFDNKYIPATTKKYLAVKPDLYYFLVGAMADNGFSILNKDIGGEGSIARGEMGYYMGFHIFPAATLPFADNSSASFHAVDASTSVGVAFTEDAAGTVKLMDVQTRDKEMIERNGHLLVSRYAVGHGALRPECAAELRLSAPA
jgi:hypothetical protein